MGKLNPVVVNQMERMIAKGSSIRYIAYATGVTAQTVRKYAGPDYRAKKESDYRKESAFRVDAGTHYTEALPKEQWAAAKVFLLLIKRAKDMKIKTDINLALFRDAWQAEVARHEQ